MHRINTIIGKICSYQAARLVLTNNVKIVSFFDGSHFWGGQLNTTALAGGINRKLKVKTESRWYDTTLQAMSLEEHRLVSICISPHKSTHFYHYSTPLTTICSRADAQRSVNGLSPVKPHVIDVVFDQKHWRCNHLLIKITKPLVDAIAKLEGRNVTLADCMLEFIYASREVSIVRLEDGEDPEFLTHAQRIIRQEFHAMNTDVHWLALYLHPLCRPLATTGSIYSRTFNDAKRIAFEIAKKWDWASDLVLGLKANLKLYNNGDRPFNGGSLDAQEWWEGLNISGEDYPLKIFAIRLFSIVPHAAEVERLFSNLGGIQSVRRSNLTVPKMLTLSMLRNNYQEAAQKLDDKEGKTRRRATAGIGAGERIEELTEAYKPYEEVSPPEDDLAGLESISLDELDAAFGNVNSGDRQVPESADGCAANVELGEVYAINELDRIRCGIAAPSLSEQTKLTMRGSGDKTWTVDDLLANDN